MKLLSKKFIVLFGSCLLTMLILRPSAPAEAMANTTTYAAFQEFERGYTIWREDTGEVMVLATSTHQVYRFPEATYDYLPENPVLDQPPYGLVKPIRGFGRVWGNFPYIRSYLGWGTNSEFGYTANFISSAAYPGSVRHERLRKLSPNR